MTKPKVAQVGGDHYEAEEQHWDLMEEFDISYLEATASKYVIRFDRKGKPREDLLKAKSYLERVIVEGRAPRRYIPNDRIHRFLVANDASPIKVSLFRLIHSADGNLALTALKFACDLIDGEVKRMEAADGNA